MRSRAWQRLSDTAVCGEGFSLFVFTIVIIALVVVMLPFAIFRE